MRLFAEDQLERRLQCRSVDQQVPVEVSDLVPEMAEQRPVWLAKSDAARLALDVVRFRKVERDETLKVSRQNEIALIREDVE